MKMQSKFAVKIGTATDRGGYASGKTRVEHHADLDKALNAAKTAAGQGKTAEVHAAGIGLITVRGQQEAQASTQPWAQKPATADQVAAAKNQAAVAASATKAANSSPSKSAHMDAAQENMTAATLHGATGNAAMVEAFRTAAQAHSAKAIMSPQQPLARGVGGDDRKRDDHGRFA